MAVKNRRNCASNIWFKPQRTIFGTNCCFELKSHHLVFNWFYRDFKAITQDVTPLRSYNMSSSIVDWFVPLSLFQCIWEERVHAGNTTYTADNHVCSSNIYVDVQSGHLVIWNCFVENHGYIIVNSFFTVYSFPEN